MTDHLISRSRFLDALVLDADNKTDLIQVHQALEKAVISPDEVRGVGEWRYERSIVHDGEPWCSECGEGFEIRAEKMKFCPSCGARMKGADDGTTD